MRKFGSYHVTRIALTPGRTLEFLDEDFAGEVSLNGREERDI